MLLVLPRRLALFSIVSAAALCTTTMAQADLGGTMAGVRADRARMNARLASIDKGNFARHDLTRGNGAMVREFTNPAGQVFAVTWSGPGKPDLRALLGQHFSALKPSATRRDMRGLRRPLQVAQADLQIQTSGHMGWFNGVAYIPSLATGFSTANLPVQP
uniref:DUF2844 domain-containing protein n=1 Tax=uncultured Sphingomonas sp. TaxID=158754 RepID=UPI0035C99C1E